VLADQDHLLVKREVSIPGFRYLLNRDRLSLLLQSACGISGLEDLRLDYLRYKPGMNCIARFEYAVDGKWSHGYAKAFGSDAGVKLQKAREQANLTGPPGTGRVTLQKEQILICFLPHDGKLRAMSRLMEPVLRADL